MQKIAINVDSWHSKFIQRYTSYCDYDMSRINNLCGYVRKFFFAVLGCLGLWTLGGGAAYCIMDVGIWIVAMINLGTYIKPDFPAVIILTILLIAFTVIVVGGVIWSCDKLYKSLINTSELNAIGDTNVIDNVPVMWDGRNWVAPEKSSFLILCWLRIKSWHNKICLPLKVQGTRYDEEGNSQPRDFVKEYSGDYDK